MGERRPSAGVLIGASAFVTGIAHAATYPYAAIVGISELQLSSGAYAALLLVSALATAGASIALGWASDRTSDRRVYVIASAVLGALGNGLVYAFHSRLVYVLAYTLVIPFGGALFSQTFSYARSYYDVHAPARGQLVVSAIRTVFSAAWVIGPPAAGYLAARRSVFDVYAVAVVGYLACVGLFGATFADARSRIGPTPPDAVRPPPRGDDAQLGFKLAGATILRVALTVHMTASPLAIVKNFGGTVGDVGLCAGLVAGLEIPFMLLWAFAAERVTKHALLAFNGVLYAVYLVLLSRAQSMTAVLWLQVPNAIASAALLSLSISYLQDAYRARVGLSTSLFEVVNALSTLATAALFALLTAGSDYRLILFLGGILSAIGGATLLVGHRRRGTPRSPPPQNAERR